MEKVNDLCIDSEKMAKISRFIVINNGRELVCAVISELRAKKLTHEKIGEMFGGINKATIFRIEKGEYWPKQKNKQINLINQAVEYL